MGGMDMTGFRMIPAGQGLMVPASAPWQPIEFGYMFAMWAVMMVGMMTPSVAPMVLIYARVGRQAAATAQPFAAGRMVRRRLSACRGPAFRVAATSAQWALERARAAHADDGEREPNSRRRRADRGRPLSVDAPQGRLPAAMPGAARLHAAPWRLSRATRAARCGSGFGTALYCIGCCWALMALLFVGGVMNLLWIAALAIFVLLEKVIPAGRVVARLAGIGFAAWGVWLLFAG